jgi:hypothetical protein
MLLKLRDKGNTRSLWHLVRLLYTDMKSQVTLGDQSSAYLSILQLEGVAQGCPLLPIFFHIFVDDLLNELHRASQLHGIFSADCQDKLGGQAYADDTNALSSSNEGLPHLTTIMQGCLAEDLLLHLAVHKCQAMCFHSRGQDTALDLRCDSQTTTHTTSVRFLGLYLQPDLDLSWTVQIAKALQNGHNASSGISYPTPTFTWMSNFLSSKPTLFPRYGLPWRCGFRAPRKRNGEWHAWTAYWWMHSENRSA